MAEEGRPDALANLVETEDIWPVRERLAAFLRKTRLKNTGRPAKRNANGNTPLRERQADAFMKYDKLLPVHGHEEAIRLTATKEVPPNVLERIVARGVTEVNDILRARGVI
jgi:hypothetical protein